MKRKLSLLAIVMMMTASAFTQGIRFNAYGIYVFDDSFDSYYDVNSYYNGKVEGGLEWGAGVEFCPRPNMGIELLYLRQDANAPINYFNNGPKYNEFELDMNYIMLSFNRYFRNPKSKLEGFFGVMGGANVFNVKNPDNGRSDGGTKFAWGMKAGGNIWFNNSIALKLQAQLMSTTQAVGGGLYFGTGGVSTGLNSYSTIYHFGLGGGLVFNLPSTKTKK